MKEAVIRRKIIKILESKGYVCWYPFHIRYKKEVDIFGIYDIISINSKAEILLIQFTTLSNIRAREKKVKKFLKEHNIFFPVSYPVKSEVWGYDKRKKVFKVIKVYNG